MRKTKSNRASLDAGYDIFISFRFGEAVEEAKQLYTALVASGYSVFLSDVDAGTNLLDTISHAISSCKLAVILATYSYGQKTNNLFDTHREMTYIFQKKKPLFLIKMCNEFKHSSTDIIIGGDIMYEYWEPGKPISPDLVRNISVKFGSASGGDLEKHQQTYEDDPAAAQQHELHRMDSKIDAQIEISKI